MRNLKKIFCACMAIMMLLSLGVSAYAAEQTGSITINEANGVGVEGKTFRAYKVLDLQMVGQGYIYTVPADLKNFYAAFFTLEPDLGDFDYQVTQKIAALSGDTLFAFAAEVLNAAKNAQIVPASVTGAEGDTSVKLTGLPLGYYVVEDTADTAPVSALVLTSTNPNVTVNIKADLPTVDKKIVEGKNRVTANNAAIGDTVSYEVISRVPDMTGYTKYYFVMNDTLSKGLTFQNDVTITIGETKLTQDKDFSVSVSQTESGTEIEIVLKNFIQYKARKDDIITVCYSAILNEAAVIGTAGNPNHVYLQYSNNPNQTVDGDPENPDKPQKPIGQTPDAEVRTYVTGLELIKVDSEGNRLAGAEFEITGSKLNKVLVHRDVFKEDPSGEIWKLADGTYTAQDPMGEGIDQSVYADINTRYRKDSITETRETHENISARAAVGDDGILRLDGLSAGEYVITELRSPSGYNLLSKPFKLTVSWTAPANFSDPCQWNVSDTEVKGGYPDSLESGARIENGVIKIQVENQSGTQLPETGGMGTMLFYLIGGLLTTTAAILLIFRKRVS